jgi:alginate O-acetyltransferase complex protein AlgI
MLTMLLGGLWHGASWNFVFWGGLHGLCLAVERRFSQGKARVFSWQSVSAWLRAALVFLLVSITWVFFRSPSVDVTALTFQKLLFAANGGIQWLYLPALIAVPAVLIGGFVARSFGYHWPILSIQKSYTPAAILFEGLIIYFFAASNISPFIYFQF